MNQFLNTAVESTVEISELEMLKENMAIESYEKDFNNYMNVLNNISTEDNDKTMNAYAMHLGTSIDVIRKLSLEGKLESMKKAILSFINAIKQWLKKGWKKLLSIVNKSIDSTISVMHKFSIYKNIEESANKEIQRLKDNILDKDRLSVEVKKIEDAVDAGKRLKDIYMATKTSTKERMIYPISSREMATATISYSNLSVEITRSDYDLSHGILDIKELEDLWKFIKSNDKAKDLDKSLKGLEDTFGNIEESDKLKMKEVNFLKRKASVISTSLRSITIIRSLVIVMSKGFVDVGKVL